MADPRFDATRPATGGPEVPRDVVLPRLYRPAEIAAALGCSVWWVKDRARRRLIPFTYVGGAYRFTADHFAEIIRAHEEAPARKPKRSKPVAPPEPKAFASQRPEPTSPAVRLQARPPRRLLKAQYGRAA
ncbi:helix-turn-helix domain-containing protein [Streptomyces gobitricini]|uniref:DNA-binding protein n=1 Tax=Streptomyces gobitricini TaxID=68211 RepID=A0ABN3MRQ1_9ACTN